MTWIISADAASHYDRSRQYLNKLAKSGRVKRRKDKGKIQFLTESLDEHFGCDPYSITKNNPPSKPIANPKIKTGQKISDQEESEELEENNFNSNSITVSQVEIALKKEKIISQKIKNEYDKDRLIEKDKQEDLFFQIARDVRNSLESIPARLSSLCVGKNKHEIEQVMIGEIKNTLTILSEGI